MRTAIRRLTLASLALLPLALTSCIESKQELLIGRWFNRTNSVRFEQNGALVWNATTGYGVGTYHFDGNVQRAKSDEPAKNLTVSMVRSGRELFGEYEVSYIGNDRLRLTQTNRRSRGRTTDTAAPIIILKRAMNETDGANIVTPAEPESPDSGVTEVR